MTDGDQDHQHGSAMTDEEWQAWDEYADRVTIEVRFKAGAGEEDADERWLVFSSGAAWPREWLKREVLAVASTDSSGGCCGGGTYLLDTRERTTEWGASASVVEIVLTLAQDQMSNATWAALGVLGANLARRLRKWREERGWAGEEWDVEAVSSAAMGAVSQLFDLSGDALDSLEVGSVERRDDGVTLVEIREGTDGAVYTVEVKTQGKEGVHLARVRKITRPGTP